MWFYPVGEFIKKRATISTCFIRRECKQPEVTAERLHITFSVIVTLQMQITGARNEHDAVCTYRAVLSTLNNIFGYFYIYIEH